jgi:hypothetical protein
MVVNFGTHGISQDARKLAWTSTLNKKKKIKRNYLKFVFFSLLYVAVKRLIERLGKDKMEGKKAEGVEDLR